MNLPGREKLSECVTGEELAVNMGTGTGSVKTPSRIIEAITELCSGDSDLISLIWSECGEQRKLRTLRQILGTHTVGDNHHIGTHRSPQPHLENNS